MLDQRPEGLSPAQMRKLPPEMSHALLGRGEWSFCAMEHSRIGAVEFDAPGTPFHHIALPIERVPLKFALKMDGRAQLGRNAPDVLTVIEAGAGGITTWDDTYESACFYFTTSALGAALGRDITEDQHAVRTKVELHAPVLVRLMNALLADVEAGQPHGHLVGDSIFVAMAGHLVPEGEHRRAPRRSSGEMPRVRRALEFIHQHLVGRLSIASISEAASTSPYYLNHAFRSALGCSIWQYVLKERATYALALMRDPRLSLAQVSQLAGFDTYASFISSTRRTFDRTPQMIRSTLA